MRNKEQKVKLIQMLRSCIRGEIQELGDHLSALISGSELDFHEQCLVLFLTGEYIRISGDGEFYQRNAVRIAELQDQVEAASLKPYHRFLGGQPGYYSENYGMAYGALYNSNLFAKREKTAKAIHEMKNYAYDHYTCAGKLVDEKEGKTSTAQMLWLCVPFGLFTPEDLVLVAALEEMKDTTAQEDYAMLGWYFAEKADYRQARSYLGRLDKRDPFVQAVGDVIEEKLRAAGMLSENPLLHVPCGNFNRYEHQNYEREPWYPKEGEEVFLNAVMWPVRYPEEVKAVWSTTDGRGGTAPGYFQPEYENYRFSIGRFQGGENVTYFFQAGDYRSEEYHFTVLEKETVTEFRLRIENGEDVGLELISGLGNQYLLSRKRKKGQLLFSVEPVEEGENTVSAGGMIPDRKTGCETAWQPFTKLMDVCGEWMPFSVEELYFWRMGNQIFSSGMKIKARKSERFYGFGERYNQIDQRGNKVDVYVYNQYKEQGIRTYFPMPYFLSSDRYGIYLPVSHYTEFDMCAENKELWQVESETAGLSWYYFAGTPKEMIGQFTSVAGKPVMMPEWAFGPWMSSNNWDSEAEVRKQVELTKKYDIPATVLVIEAWSDEATYYIFNDASYEENSGEEAFSYKDFDFPKWGKWPDPKKMVEYLHENGLKCILWQIPIIKYINSLHHLQKDRDEEFALAHGYCAVKKDKTPYRMPEGWFTDSLLMDYTNEEAVNWWMKKRQYLVDDIQIDGFKTDGGEFVFGDDVRFWDGRTGKEMRNEYPNLYIKKHYDFIHERRDGIVFSRAGFSGAAQMPAHWAGDERSTFSAFQRNLCAGLNAGISGVPFWGWDLAGFSGEIPSAELFARSASMAAFCPIMQYHAESKAEFNQDRTPWNIAERRNAPWIIDVYRYYAKLRMAMLPYIMEEAAKSAETGVPLMRALWVEFPDDDEAGSIYDQYLFGDDFLVAPIVEEGAREREVYVPKGNWINLFTDQEFTGEQWVTMHAEVDEILVLKRRESRWHVKLGENMEFVKENE